MFCLSWCSEFQHLICTETLAMKGLTLNCVDKKTEAYELVRKGLKVGICFIFNFQIFCD